MRVLVATDLSDAADVALRQGCAMASGPADALAVVHVVPPPRLLDPYLPSRAEDRTEVRARAGAAVEGRLRRVCERRAEIFIEDGPEYAELVRRAERWNADVVVVGSHGRSGVARLLGGVAEGLVRDAHCDVLVARAGSDRGWVLAATDLSEISLAAIEVASGEARRRGARLEVIRAVGFLDAQASYALELGTPSISPAPNVFEVAAREVGDTLDRLGVDGTCKIVDRPAAAAIVGEAESIGAELIVVGSRGRSGLARLALGSVAERVMRAATCSVLVVRPKR